MKILELFGVKLPEYSTLPVEKQKELDIFRISFRPLQYGAINIVVLGVALMISNLLSLGILVGSAILYYTVLQKLKADATGIAKEVNQLSSKIAFEGDGQKMYEDDIAEDRLFVRMSAQLQIIYRVALILLIIVSFCFVISSFFLVSSLFAIGLAPFWFYMSLIMVDIFDEAVNDDFDISLNGALGKLLATDTIQASRGL